MESPEKFSPKPTERQKTQQDLNQEQHDKITRRAFLGFMGGAAAVLGGGIYAAREVAKNTDFVNEHTYETRGILVRKEQTNVGGRIGSWDQPSPQYSLIVRVEGKELHYSVGEETYRKAAEGEEVKIKLYMNPKDNQHMTIMDLSLGKDTK